MSATVTVACKLPHGLVLRVFDKASVHEPMPGGGTKPVARFQPRPQTVAIKGYLNKYKPGLPPAAVGSSYALTHGVDKEFFDEWMKQNAEHDAVLNGLIFADEKNDTVNGLVKDNADTRSGFEPVDPTKLPRRIESYSQDAA